VEGRGNCGSQRSPPPHNDADNIGEELPSRHVIQTTRRDSSMLRRNKESK